MMAEHPISTKCRACGGGGFLSYRQYDNNLHLEYERIARCGHCENWLNKVGPTSIIPRYTTVEINVRGGRCLFEGGKSSSPNKTKGSAHNKSRHNRTIGNHGEMYVVLFSPALKFK